MIPISIAAGYNKFATLHTDMIKKMGLKRNVIGTLTYLPYNGSSKYPRIKKVENVLLNRLGLPNQGAQATYEIMNLYHTDKSIPITISISPTPFTETEQDQIDDVMKTVHLFKDEHIDRFELNISCPTGEVFPIKRILEVIKSNKKPHQSTYVKMSPQSSDEEIDLLLNNMNLFEGVVLTNTLHKEGYGVSGKILTKYIDELLVRFKNMNLDIIVCGGITSLEDVKKYEELGVKEVQAYTAFINNPFSFKECE